MDRRRLVRSLPLALLTGCLADPPRGTGPRNPPTEAETVSNRSKRPVRVATFDIEEADDGSLRVVGEVRNDRAVEKHATVRAVATVDGSRTSAETTLRIPPGERRPFELTLGVSYDAFSSGGNLDVGVV